MSDPISDAPLYDVAHVRALVIEDHGDDLVIEIRHKRGSTRTQIDKSEIVNGAPLGLARARSGI